MEKCGMREEKKRKKHMLSGHVQESLTDKSRTEKAGHRNGEQHSTFDRVGREASLGK